MTAEVAVMNKLAIALAADSAVTITTEQGQKVYNSANKLFTLSKFAPVGLLLYNATEINGIPLEVVIKEFREQLGNKRFKELSSYVDAFWRFLEKGPPITASSRQQNFERLFLMALREIYFRALRIRINEEVPESDFNTYLLRAVEELSDVAAKVGKMGSLSHVKWEVLYSQWDFIKEVHKHVREKFGEEHELAEIKEELSASVERLSALLIFSNYRLDGYTGVVIAGFGDSEYFPSLFQFVSDGFIPCGLRRAGPETDVIGRKNDISLNAFAQREMTQVFMEGIDQENWNFIRTSLSGIFNGLPEVIAKHLGVDKEDQKIKDLSKALKDTLRQFYGDLKDHTKEKFTDPVLEAIRHLEKNDLASMAESLVAITALKRRVTLGAETVGGPIDVAVISKGDGFIWIKRKHYFDIELNRSFMQRYLPVPQPGDEHGQTQRVRAPKSLPRRR